MVDQGLADLLAEPGQIIEGARGHTGFVKHPREMPADEGRLFGRLEDHGIARGQCGHGHAAGYGQRKIPGGDNHRHAARDVLGKIGLARHVAMPGLGEPDHLPRVEFAEIDGLGDVGIRFFPGLAAFIDFPRRQVEPAAAHDRRGLDQDVGPSVGRGRCPLRRSGSGGGHRQIGMVRPGHGHLADDARALAGIDRIEPLGLGVDLPAVDDQAVALAELRGPARVPGAWPRGSSHERSRPGARSETAAAPAGWKRALLRSSPGANGSTSLRPPRDRAADLQSARAR